MDAKIRLYSAVVTPHGEGTVQGKREDGKILVRMRAIDVPVDEQANAFANFGAVLIMAYDEGEIKPAEVKHGKVISKI